jgi:hypothetical protein
MARDQLVEHRTAAAVWHVPVGQHEVVPELTQRFDCLRGPRSGVYVKFWTVFAENPPQPANHRGVVIYQQDPGPTHRDTRDGRFTWQHDSRFLQKPGQRLGMGFRAIYPVPWLDACAASRLGYGRAAMVEPGLVTLAKIVGTLLFAMSVVPFLFLLAPGDRTEPEVKDTFDGDVQ